MQMDWYILFYFSHTVYCILRVNSTFSYSKNNNNNKVVVIRKIWPNAKIMDERPGQETDTVESLKNIVF